MILLLLVLCAGGGAALSGWGLARPGRRERVGATAGVVALLLVMVLAFAMEGSAVPAGGSATPGSPLGGHFVPSSYLRLVVGIWALMSVLVMAVAALLGGLPALRGLLPATLAAIAGGTVALAASNLGLAAAAATATGLAGLLVILAADGPATVAVAARELRITLVGGALLLAAVAMAPLVAHLVLGGIGGSAAGGDAPAFGPVEAGAVIGLLALAGAAVVGLRYGVLPFHLRVPRLADVVRPVDLPLLLAWIPLPLAVVGIVMLDELVAPLALALDGERVLIIAFALLTLVGAALAAYLQDDLRHAAGYLVIADAGVLILALAALDPAAWGPTRAWIVVLAASKTALGVWAAVAEDRFGTRSIPDLRGWARRSPLLAAGLLLTALATYGLPGWVAFEARASVASLVAEGPPAALLMLAGLLTLPTYVRLLVLGAGRVTSRVDGAAPERIVRRRSRQSAEILPVEVESDEAGTVSAPAVAVAAVSAPNARTAPAGARVTAMLQRDRTELLSAAVLALAILAALTSWGALDIGGASAEPAPIEAGPGND